MQLTSAPAVTKRVGEFDTLTKDYPAYVAIDGVEEYIGSRRTQGEADRLCDEYAYNFYADHHTPEVAAQIAVGIDEAERREAETENEPRETPTRRVRGAFAALSNEALVNWSESPVA